MPTFQTSSRLRWPSSTHAVIDDILNRINLLDACCDNDGLIRIRRPVTTDAKLVHGFLQSSRSSRVPKMVTAPLPQQQQQQQQQQASHDECPMVHAILPVDSLAQYLSSTCVEYDGFQPVFIVVEERNASSSSSSDDDWIIRSLAQWSFGYSTWKGRVMNLNVFISGKYESILMKLLATIATELDCKRLVHQKLNKPSADSFCKLHNAEELPEWLQLQLGICHMTALLNKTKFRQEWSTFHENYLFPPHTSDRPCTTDIIVQTLEVANEILIKKSEGSGKKIKLRLASERDANHILNLVKGLAVFEKAADEVIVNSEIYKRDGCGVRHPIFHCILVESLNDESNSSNVVVGMGLFYFGYDALNGGRFLFLEDLFIEQEYRGLGCGTCIMTCLADISLKTGCSRFVWQVLDWNTPAIEFYKTIGATVCNNVLTVRLNYDRICDTAIK